MKKTILTFLLFTLAVIISPAISAEGDRVMALTGGTLIDGYGGKPIPNSVILVEGKTIIAVGQVGSLEIPDGAELISTEGMSVLPGMWDMHVHLMINGHADYAYWDKAYLDRQTDLIMPSSALQLLHAGVTSARDLGAPLEEIIEVRDRINAGELDGPTLYVSGPFIQHKPYPDTEFVRWGVDGVEDARAKVRKLAEAGVDTIKLIDQDQMTMEEVQAVVDEAHAHDLTVVAHSHRPEEIRRGLIAGVDCFEHTGLATAPEYPADVMEMLKERTAQMNLGPLFWTPTVQGLYLFEYMRDNPEEIDDPSWHLGLPPEVVEDIRQSLTNLGRLPYFQITPNRRPTLKHKIEQLKEAGVVILVGTDSGIPRNFHSQTTWRELDVLVNDMGLDALETIKGATYWPSVLMGVSDKVGTIEEGKDADIIAVRGDVLRHISLLRDPEIIIKHGKRYE